MKGIRYRLSDDRGAELPGSLIAGGDHLGRHQRARAIVDSDEDRARICEGCRARKNGLHTLLAARHDLSNLLKFSGEGLKLLDPIRGADQDDVVNIRTIVEGRKTVRDERSPAQGS